MTFFGLDKDHWDVINSFANWISAIGTVAAVITSLWLAARPDRVKLRVSACVRMLVTHGGDDRPRYVEISVTNLTRRPIKINGIGWVVGKPRRSGRVLHQMPDYSSAASSPLPVIIDDGEDANWYFPLDTWMENTETFYTPDWEKTARNFRVLVWTSLGQRFHARVAESLQNALRASLQGIARDRGRNP